MDLNNILGVVLAGGRSKRFGEDKNQAKLGNLTLLEHVLFKITAGKKGEAVDIDFPTEESIFEFL